MSVGPQILSYGNVSGTYVVQVNLTPASVAATTTAEQTFTVPGLAALVNGLGDQVSALSYQAAWTASVDYINVRISANNTLAVSFQNNTGSPVTPPAGVYLLEINRIGIQMPNAIQ